MTRNDWLAAIRGVDIWQTEWQSNLYGHGRLLPSECG